MRVLLADPEIRHFVGLMESPASWRSQILNIASENQKNLT